MAWFIDPNESENEENKLENEAGANDKKATIGKMVHDLKAPLQSIVSSVDLLSARGVGKDKNAEVWQRLVTATEHLEIKMKELGRALKSTDGDLR